MPTHTRSAVRNRLAPLPPVFGRVAKPRTRRNARKKPLPVSPLPDVPASPVSTQDTLRPPSSPPTKPAPLPPSLSLAFTPQGAPLSRESHYARIRTSLLRALTPAHRALSLYVSGTPGTGKTLTVSSALSSLSLPPSRSVWLNCAHLGAPRNLFSALCSALGLSGDPEQAVRAFASSAGERVVLVLDEVDFLVSRDQLVLYAAFEWPHLPSSRLSVIGIANAVDLPVRLLPWLRANACMPELLPFAPYTSDALQEIVRQRLAPDGALSKVAVQLAAKKVAAGSGDARLVLDVCREAESQVARADGGSAIAVVSRILQARGGLSQAVDTISQLPVQQQLALCVAANAVTMGGKSAKKATLGGLYESFARMCSRAKVGGVTFDEFAQICCNALASHGLLDVAQGRGKKVRTIRSKLVRLKVDVDDVRAGVAGRGFLPLLIAR